MLGHFLCKDGLETWFWVSSMTTLQEELLGCPVTEADGSMVRIVRG